jgi:hypothetical protein
MIHPRLRVALGAMVGGLLWVAFLPIAVAAADDFYYLPDQGSFEVTQVTGIAPFTPVEAMGTESWSIFDVTTSQVVSTDLLTGADTFTQFGSFTNDLLAVHIGLLDFANFGGGWANEWVDFNSNVTFSGLSDLLITPFGDFTLFGDYPFTL